MCQEQPTHRELGSPGLRASWRLEPGGIPCLGASMATPPSGAWSVLGWETSNSGGSGFCHLSLLFFPLPPLLSTPCTGALFFSRRLEEPIGGILLRVASVWGFEKRQQGLTYVH